MTVHAERRHAQRVTATGNAVVHSHEGVGRGTVVDLSLAGVCLHLESVAMLGLTRHEWVKIDLHLEANRWHSLHGWVARAHAPSGRVALHFGEVPAAFEDTIEDEVLASLECIRTPRVIVIDGSRDRRRRLVATLHAIGCSTLEASTPLDAIGLIERSHSHVVLAAIAEDQHDGRQIRAFLAESHPEIHLAVIADRVRPGTLREADLGPQVQRWLRTPASVS